MKSRIRVVFADEEQLFRAWTERWKRVNTAPLRFFEWWYFPRPISDRTKDHLVEFGRQEGITVIFQVDIRCSYPEYSITAYR